MIFRIVATNLPVAIGVPLFAALDVCDKLTWTDQAFHAAQFDTMVDAEDFARERIEGGDWKVMPA